MSENTTSETGEEEPNPYPDSPVTYVEIHHEDGTVKQLSGKDAEDWASWVDQGVSLAATRGHQPPAIDWDVEVED